MKKRLLVISFRSISSDRSVYLLFTDRQIEPRVVQENDTAEKELVTRKNSIAI